MEFDKSKVYTAVNAEELKVGDKVYAANNLKALQYDVVNDKNLAVIQEIFAYDCTDRFKIKFIGSAIDNQYSLAYLVERAEEKKLRPFNDVQELINAWQKKTGITARANTMPLIWLRNKESKCIGSISSFGAIDVFIFGCWKYMDELFDDYEFLDGTPCGVEY